MWNIKFQKHKKPNDQLNKISEYESKTKTFELTTFAMPGISGESCTTRWQLKLKFCTNVHQCCGS